MKKTITPLSYHFIKCDSDRIAVIPMEKQEPYIDDAYILIVSGSAKLTDEEVKKIINKEYIIYVLQEKLLKIKQQLEQHTINLWTFFKDIKAKRDIEKEITLLENKLSELKKELHIIHKEAIIRTAINKTDLENVKQYFLRQNREKRKKELFVQHLRKMQKKPDKFRYGYYWNPDIFTKPKFINTHYRSKKYYK